jgi:threonine/homoserine/homoserine lactone efflux protein
MSNHILALASLALVALVTSAVPGPNIFLVMRLAMARGRGPALAAALGTTAGCIVWCAAAALGLAALLTAAPWLYKILRVAGGLYLLWFAFQLWTSRPQAPDAAASEPGAVHGAFWRALIVCLTNPKSVLFFGSIFAAYMGPDTPLWMHLSAVAIVVGECAAFYAAVAWLFSARRAAAAYARAQRPLDRAAAAVMAVFGLGLFWVFD